MAYVPVPKDLTKVKTKVAFNLTKRQLVCFGGGALLGVPLFFLLRGSAGNSTAALCMMFVMLPFFLLAMYEKHGQPLEKIVGNIIRVTVIRPRQRPYRTNTVTTKAGNYFYILIDRANEDKETAVHFLNQVDEADLMALMEDGQSAEKPPVVCNCTEKCEAGAVNTKCEVCSTDMTGCTGKEAEPETPAEPAEPEKKESAGLNPVVLLLVLAVMGGAAFTYFKFIKGKANHKNSSNPDDYDYEDGEELPDEEEIELEDEESGEPDADGGSAEEDDEDSVK